MKKVATKWFLAILVFAGCADQKPEGTTLLGMGTDYVLYPEILKGRVREVSETNYWAIEKDGNITKGDPATWSDLDSIGSTKNFVAKFDSTGVLTYFANTDEKSVERNSTRFIIENGKCVKWEFNVNDSAYAYLVTEYNESGKLSGGTVFRPLVDTVLNKYIIRYDDKGNYSQFDYINSRNQKTGTQVLSVDEIGRVTSVKFYNRNDTLRQTFTHTYNEKGFLEKQVTLIEKPQTTITWELNDLKLDEKGNRLIYYCVVDSGKFRLYSERAYIYY